MTARALGMFAIVVLLTSSLLAQAVPKEGAPQRGGAKPAPPQGPLGEGFRGEGFRGGPRGPQGEEEIVGNNLGEAALREVLTATFDANADGRLEGEECARAIAAIRDRQALAARGVQPVLTEQDIVQMFDADGNGQLSVPEYASACRGMDAVLGEGASQRITQRQGGEGQGGPRFGGGPGGGRPKGFGGRGGRGGGRGR